MGLHIGYCESFGISKEEIESAEESQGKGLVSECFLAVANNTPYSMHSIHEV
jgi:hypothetical protein